MVPKSRHIQRPHSDPAGTSRRRFRNHADQSRQHAMRIAQISPLFEAVPPKLYGGTERVVYSLTEELVAMGHDVTLFASGDSVTSATLAPMREKALRLDPTVKDWVALYYRMVELIYRRKDEFDVLHFHLDYFPLSQFSRQNVPFLTTLHGRLDLREFGEVFGTFRDCPFVSISDSQRKPIPQLNWVRTVLHGIPEKLLTPQPAKQEYLAFLGRISPEKGIDRAIKIAGRAGIKLKVAAKIDNADKQYYDAEIKHLIEGNPNVEFIGEINDQQKPEFLSGAHALLFPINWPEPFGLVMIEAMACGTPVIAFRSGSVPEVIDDGVSGFIVANEDEAVAATKRLHQLNRTTVRETFDRRWTARRMAEDYVDVYQELAQPMPRLRAVNA
jgi:glycosyltransferase involved in cell wall biosynthesis